MKFLSIIIFLLFPSIVLGNSLGGTGWLYKDNSGNQLIILFEKFGNITYLNQSRGDVFRDGQDTWTIQGEKVILSFTNGYTLCSLKKISLKSMVGDCINKVGRATKVVMNKIE